MWLVEPLTPWTLEAVLIVCGWLLWTGLLTSLISAAHTRVARRRGRVVRWRIPRPLQALAAVLVGTAAVGAAAGPVAAASPSATAGSAFDVPGRQDVAPRSGGPQETRPKPPEPATVTVQPGDTLFGIADDALGDGDRWPEIYDLNQGRPFPGRADRLTYPDRIHPGLVLTLPTTSNGPDIPSQVAPQDQERPPPDTEPTSPASEGLHCDTPAVPPSAAGSTPDARTSAEAQPTAHADSVAEDGRGIQLPSGSWVTMGLAAAIVSATATVWAYRRVRYVPRPLSATPRLDDPQLTPMPRIVTDLRHHLHAATEQPAPDTPPAEATVPAAESEPAPPLLTGEPAAPPWNPETGAWPPTGLSLAGPGAVPAARGTLITVLAVSEPGRHRRVILTADAVTALAGPDTPLPDIPQLTITADLDTALTICETEALHRTRLIDGYDADTITDLRAHDPAAEPTPPILLITTPPAHHTDQRLAALLTHGHRLDIHGLLLGPWPPAHTVTVNDDGTVQPAPGAPAPGMGPFSMLQPAEVLDLLTVLAEAHTVTTPAATSHDAPPQPTPRTPPQSGAGRPEAAPATSVPDGQSRPVRVHVLGGAQIDGVGPEQHLRAKSLELLVYLAARGGSGHHDTICEDLIPEARAARAPHRLHTYVYALRKALKHAGGPGTYVIHGRHQYALDAEALDIDLWRMQAAIHDAQTTTDPTTRIDALQRAVAAYTGPLADGHDYEWAEPYREAIRQQALDAHAALADTLTSRPAEQLAVLHAAIRHDPYAEHFYQQAMHANAALGRPDGIRDLRRTLTRRLAEIDAEPSDDTLHLADTLTTNQAPMPGAPPRTAA